MPSRLLPVDGKRGIIRATLKEKQMAATTTQIITSDELVKVLETQRGATFISFLVETDAKMRKTGNPYLGAKKVAKVHGMLNFLYDEAVQRRLEKEGKPADSFRKGESWHEIVTREDGTLTPFCRHKETGELYLRFMHQNTLDAIYVDVNGNRISVDEITPFLQKPSGYGNQGLDNPVRILTYKLSGIREITLNGTTYQIAKVAVIPTGK